jgi:hypothetical protein
MSNRDGDQVAGWIAELDDLQLSISVPVELRKLFSVARAALAYSFVYYPFLILGSAQSLRVAEGAVSQKCNTLGAPRRYVGRFIEKSIGLQASKYSMKMRVHAATLADPPPLLCRITIQYARFRPAFVLEQIP